MTSMTNLIHIKREGLKKVDDCCYDRDGANLRHLAWVGDPESGSRRSTASRMTHANLASE